MKKAKSFGMSNWKNKILSNSEGGSERDHPLFFSKLNKKYHDQLIQSANTVGANVQVVPRRDKANGAKARPILPQEVQRKSRRKEKPDKT